LTTLLLLSAAVLATQPASANWFFRPGPGISLNVGSAPNPTPNDLRALYGPLRHGVYPATRTSLEVLRDMEGKAVYGEAGEELGYILAVDQNARLASVQLDTGIAIAVEAHLLINETDRVIAPTLSRADTLVHSSSSNRPYDGIDWLEDRDSLAKDRKALASEFLD
jgi:hypothetical protein